MKPFIYKIGQVVNNLEIIDLQRKPTGNTMRILKVCSYKCIKCGYEGEIREDTLKHGSGCVCCANNVVVEHINSIVANKETHWMIQYFEGGWNEAKLYTSLSHKKILPICPQCGKQQNKPVQISTIKVRQGISCEYCGRTKSYPERLMASLLTHLNIEYEQQLTKRMFAWCKDFQYDFYIPSLNAIIETHGGQHYYDTNRTKLIEVCSNDEEKRKVASSNVDHYIVLDCRKSNLNWIKNSILQSKLATLLDLNNVDWECVSLGTIDNFYKQVWQFWNEHMYNTTLVAIAKEFKVSRPTIKKILQNGARIGVIDFDENILIQNAQQIGAKNAGKANKRDIYVYKDNTFIKKYDSIVSLIEHSKQDFGTQFTRSKVSTACSKGLVYKGYTFFKESPETTKRENIQNG
jgi:hypothetical protein|nr:MAG TPA: restriction enzyme [Caudoviricetes sp.]